MIHADFLQAIDSALQLRGVAFRRSVSRTGGLQDDGVSGTGSATPRPAERSVKPIQACTEGTPLAV